MEQKLPRSKIATHELNFKRCASRAQLLPSCQVLPLDDVMQTCSCFAEETSGVSFLRTSGSISPGLHCLFADYFCTVD